MAGGAIAGSGRAFRLDPNSLPVRSSARTGAVFVIERDCAIVRRPAIGGASVTLTVPLADYRGIAVRMDSTGDNGEVRARLELLHADPSLTLPLAATDKPEEIAADWRAWARALGLPLLVVGQDGSVGEPFAEMGGVLVAPPKPRRRHSYFAARRPRFLARRKTGRIDVAVRVAGREIIARD